MRPAQEESVGDVGFSVVGLPMVDVVGFGPGWWPVAVRPAAAAVAGGESGALPFGEEALVASDVDALAVVIEFDGGESGAGVPLHGFE